MQSLVLMLNPPDAHMFLSMTKAALALPILAVTSRSVPLCWSTISLMGSPPQLVLTLCFHHLSGQCR